MLYKLFISLCWQLLAFVLVAGGLGERLGYNGIKIAIPYEIFTMKSYLEYYIDYINALELLHDNLTSKIPLIIMVSNDTEKLTLKLLNDHDYFHRKSSIYLIKQDGVPALSDNNATMILNSQQQI